jgi:hypothetical protein
MILYFIGVYLTFLYFEAMLLTKVGEERRSPPVENEHRTYGITEWAAALRVKRTEEELAAATREREAARGQGPRGRNHHSPQHLEEHLAGSPRQMISPEGAGA